MFAMVKAIVPRYRYDQLMRLGWKVFLPLSIAVVVIVRACCSHRLGRVPSVACDVGAVIGGWSARVSPWSNLLSALRRRRSAQAGTCPSDLRWSLPIGSSSWARCSGTTELMMP